MTGSFDFSGWATRNDLTCADGRIIKRDAFKDCDGTKVPLCWNHDHNSPDKVLGHALLENRDEGVYAYCSFNDTDSAKEAKELVAHGDVRALSIFANKLKQNGNNVLHGAIREVSLVLAGANPGAYIEEVLEHGDILEDSLNICYDEGPIVLYHSGIIEHSELDDEKKEDNESEKKADNESAKNSEDESKETIEDIIESMNQKQQNVLYGLVGRALEEGGNKEMKHNVFEQDDVRQDEFLSHADEMTIVANAKKCGSFKQAFHDFMEANSLKHGFEDYEELFPDYEWTKPGAPEMLTRDQSWVDSVLNKVHKSPIARIKTRQADVRPETIRAMGYEKTKEKKLIGSIKLINRSTDPQTVYVKDKIERDDMVDITDFDVVEYQRKVMRMALNEELATAIMIGDGREDGEEGKIYEEHIRPIWTDSDLYTIHTDVDIAAAKKELQGTNTEAYFGENYIYAEAIITAALYAREKYKGSGALDFYCTPHLLNVMLLARDLNGRRIYDSKSDLAAALNVGAIHTVEQFEGKTRKTEDGETKKLLGLFVNLADYHLGATKGGQITNFDDFDIDFNQYKYLMETRVSGANTKVFSAIALEEPVVTVTP